ncbi:MAG: hypothetical protein IRZ07_18110 [Microbispora sp.]|nr:hypothetical protein [Microbispora sp.]
MTGMSGADPARDPVRGEPGAALVAHVCDHLAQAGFPVVECSPSAWESGELDVAEPGLVVYGTPGGAVVRWAATDGFTAWTNRVAAHGVQHVLHTAVRTAVATTLRKAGYEVTDDHGSGELFVRCPS